MKSILKSVSSFLLLGVILTTQSSLAQNAEDYFHDGAQTFINGNIESAIARVQQGLSQFPNDPKLNELLAKLEEEQEQQQQQQQQQQNQQQENQNEDQENQNQEQQNQEQENQEEQEQQENEQNEENQEQNPEEQQAQPKDAREGE